MAAASAINSTLYGTRQFTQEIARSGEMPQELDAKIGGRRIVGLLITGAGTLVLVNSVSLESISMMGSAVFLLVFAAVHLAAWRLRSDLTGWRWIPLLGVALTMAAFGSVVAHTIKESPLQLLALAGIIVVSTAIELPVLRLRRPRRRRLHLMAPPR